MTKVNPIFAPTLAYRRSQALSLWIADKSQGVDLVLLEDFPRDDTEKAFGMTALTTLIWFLHNISDELEAEIGPVRLLLDKAGLEMCEDNFVRQKPGVPDEESVSQMDLIGVLRRIGCDIGPPRAIETLYRVRSFNSRQIFGYPIFVREA